MKQDNINSPNHYCLEGLDGLEVIDIIKSILGKEGFKAYCQGNVIKYVLRAKKKNGVEDLKKAIKYLEWEIEEIENKENCQPYDFQYLRGKFDVNSKPYRTVEIVEKRVEEIMEYLESVGILSGHRKGEYI